MRELMEEEPDAAAAFADRDFSRPEEACWPPWSGHIQIAWNILRDDRHIGAMGGIGRIYFHAIEAYARRYGIEGSDFDWFVLSLRALDDEYVAYANEKARAEMEKTRSKK